jgi:arylsulfotransferase ASST
MVATAALMIAGLLGARAGAQPPQPGQVSFSSVPSLSPKFGPNIHDYVVRCNDAPVTVEGHASGGWEAAIGNHPFRSGDFSETVPLSSGRAFTITVREVGRPELYRYHVRCLPSNFPTYTFTRYGPVSPKYFSAARADRSYGMIFDNHGVPIWWIHAPTWASRVLPDGSILWFHKKWQIHRLDGSLVRTLDAVGHPANGHDLWPLGNGDYLVGADVKQSHVDTSAYGGSSDADVVNAELQQVSPDGQLVWDWKSQDHISLAETPEHRWRWAVSHPTPQGYDILHWNSIEPAGNSVIASFRHLDAVYKIRQSTGKIVWKLGGTTTPRSLAVKGDPRAYTFGAQHDARLLGDGTLTVFDNRTNLTRKTPRAVRFRIDRQPGTATLLQSISDPPSPSPTAAARPGAWATETGWSPGVRTPRSAATSPTARGPSS